MNPYVLGVDVWEGAMDVNEDTMRRAGVAFMVIRINDMDGGLHEDKNFKNQWQQARNLIRWPYFVYSPWADAATNFNYLNSLMPGDAKHVSLDIEVVRSGYSPSDYARQVMSFVSLCASRWGIDIYTGAWFLPYLSTWPQNVPYWMARYPYDFYPKKREQWTWEKLKAKLDAYPWDPGRAPGPCKLWQLSGDRLTMPGCADRAMDVNAFNGTLADLEAYAGMKLPAYVPAQPQPPGPLNNTFYYPFVGGG